MFANLNVELKLFSKYICILSCNSIYALHCNKPNTTNALL